MHIHIEPTNNCNTHCIFCPREKTPTAGYMDQKIFHTIIQRAKEFQEQFKKLAGIYNIGTNRRYQVVLCGLGEPLLHPNIVDFISYVSQYGIKTTITTNGSLLNSKLSKSLIDAGLNEIIVSASGIDNIYKKIHKLDFEIIENNILSCLKYSKNKCNVYISITKCPYNKTSIDQIKEYWMHKGITQFLTFEENNRGGAYDNHKSYINGNIQVKETKQLLKDRNIIPICMAPFMEVFIGWDGMYYMCCNDFQKKYPLESVETKSFADMRDIKIDYYNRGLSICKSCDNNPFNIIRSILIDMKNKKKEISDLEAQLEHAKSDSHIIYGDYGKALVRMHRYFPNLTRHLIKLPQKSGYMK
jgi:MoaA/NifB/PqqE/SkfB family radical SAM enzyme